jgi:hypothetical protein
MQSDQKTKQIETMNENYKAMQSAVSTHRRAYSILENGTAVSGLFAIGTVFNTQWGPRKVVSTHVEILDITPDCPHGC